MATPALIAQHLTRRFEDRRAVEDVSFDLASGEIFALLGPNGAGKTTTLRMLAGLISPTTGSVYVDGEPMTPDSASRLRGRIGFLTEAPGLWDKLTVRQNLRIYAELYGLAPGKAVDDALTTFDMADRAEDRAARLSKGLKQRVALARTLLHKPAIVLLDEPTAGLDPESAKSVRELIVRLRAEGRAVMLCTHNLDEAERLADRVAIIRSRMLALDTPARLRAQLFQPRVRVVLTSPAQQFAGAFQASGAVDVRFRGIEASVGLDGGIAVAEIVRCLVHAGAEIESVVREEPPLEEVYLRLLHEKEGRP